MNVAIARLRGQVADDRAAAERQLDRLAALEPLGGGSGALAETAIALHRFYAAVESVIERCTVALEGSRPSGPASHRELLDGAAREVPGVRGLLLSRELVHSLHEFLAFRHFFHHAYDADFEPGRLASLRAAALALRPRLALELDSLDGYLAQVAEAGTPS